MTFFCPKCATELEAGTDLVGTIACPACGEALDLTVLRAATCPICGSGFEETDTIRICPDCKTPHHDECWAENRGCSTYGCSSAAHQETHTAENDETGSEGGSGLIPCPACGAMHPATDLVCSACGKLFGDSLPGDSAGTRLKETVGRLGSEAKTKLWPRLVRNFRLLGQNLSVVFRLWWGEFSRYTEFSGKTTRRAHIAFWAVNAGAIWLFAICEAEPLVVITLVAVFLPTTASIVRRLRDTDISPWLVFAFPLLPFLLLVPSVSSDSSNETTDVTEETSS